MNRTAKATFILLYVCVGFVAAGYIAALAYFLVNKTMPTDLAADTWYRYWTVYSVDPVQHKRLVGSAFVALSLVYGAPLVLVSNLMRRPRSLHGDARWATEREIRNAGLL